MNNQFPVKPVGSKLLVLPIKKNEVTVGGLAVAEAEKLDKGKVVAVSDEIASVVAVDDVVLYANHKTMGQIANGELYQWLDLTDLWGISNEQ